MPRTRSSTSCSAGRLTRNTLYGRPLPQPESAAYKYSMPVPVRDKDEPNIKPSLKEQAMARPDRGQEDDDLSPADQAQIEESARFEGPNGELLNRYGRRLLGPEGTILINTDSTPLESWETGSIEAGNRNFHSRSLSRGVNGEQGKHRKVPLARERTEPAEEPLGRHRHRMFGPEGTILIREEPPFSQDDGRPLHRANGAPQFRRVGFGPEGTELIET